MGSVESVDQEAEPGSDLLGLRCIRRTARDAVSHGTDRSWLGLPHRDNDRCLRLLVFFNAVRAAQPSDQARIVY